MGREEEKNSQDHNFPHIDGIKSFYLILTMLFGRYKAIFSKEVM